MGLAQPEVQQRAVLSQCSTLVLSRALDKTDIAEMNPCSLHAQAATWLFPGLAVGF